MKEEEMDRRKQLNEKLKRALKRNKELLDELAKL